MRALAALPALLLLGAAPVQKYAIDPAASEVAAKVAFFGLASKTAHFPQMSGGIALSPDAPGRIDLNITLDARSLTASDDVTLSRLKGPDFFSVDRYPTITFIGRDITLRGDQQAVVDGQLTARGVTRPARLTVRFERPPMPVRPGEPLSLAATTVIDRRDFGMTAYPLIVGRKVTISIRARMVPV